MKCPKCNGTGFVRTHKIVPWKRMECDLCDGTGVVEPMTNEEYIRTAPTTDDIVAELRKMDSWIKKKMKEEIGSYNKIVRGDYYREWLKQPHREIGK